VTDQPAAAVAHVVVGFASDVQPETGLFGTPVRMIPMPDLPGCEQVFLTLAVAREVFDEVDRTWFAAHLGSKIADKVRELITRGPTSTVAVTEWPDDLPEAEIAVTDGSTT